MPNPRRHSVAALPAPPAPARDDGWALFLDIDGTLLDFAARPDAVRVAAPLRDDLARLRERLHGALALLSGRTLQQIDALFDWRDGAAAGLHGAQWRGPGGATHDEVQPASLTALRDEAHAQASKLPGVVLEDKHHALALHYRNAPAQRSAVERLARDLLQRAGSGFALQRGDHVLELKPAGCDKGRALAALMREPPFAGRRPWMLGDDLTDEHAFAETTARGGVGVIVGERRPTCARFALADPAAVRAWLHELALRSAAAETPR